MLVGIGSRILALCRVAFELIEWHEKGGHEIESEKERERDRDRATNPNYMTWQVTNPKEKPYFFPSGWCDSKITRKLLDQTEKKIVFIRYSV